jgi:hypothetical protein
MPIQISDKELSRWRCLGKYLDSYRVHIDEMLALLDELEQRQNNAGAPAPKGKSIGVKEDRKNLYKSRIRK